MSSRIVEGDCVEAMAAMPAASVDAIVCDPPYGLEFMGKEWDRLGATADEFREQLAEDGRVDYHGKGNAPFGGGGRRVRYGSSAKSMQGWHEAWAVEALRVLKPGGHLLAFGGTRTEHRLTCAIEDAGFEIRDKLLWLYGSGFPKSLDVSKAIDKGQRREYVAAALRLGIDLPARSVDDWTREDHAPGDKWWEAFKAGLPVEDWQRIERAVIGEAVSGESAWFANGRGETTAPATPDAIRWQGWGTALKPAHEPVCMARKPLAGTVAANVLEHGTGALNVDGCRIGTSDEDRAAMAGRSGAGKGVTSFHSIGRDEGTFEPHVVGRWPANVMLDEAAAAMLDEQTGELTSGSGPLNRNGDKFRTAYGEFKGTPEDGDALYGDTGGASRFFYVAKASTAERNAGLDGFEAVESMRYGEQGQGPLAQQTPRKPVEQRNVHPTVKPIDVMRWLVRLVTPPGGTVLDPFTGSGTTGCAAVLEGFDFIGIEREEEYVQIARARIDWWAEHPDGMALVRRLEAERERKAVAESGQLDLLGEAA